MAGADGGQLRDVTRWAASFMARLFTTPAQLLDEEGVFGGGCNSLYRSVSTEEDVDPADDDATRRGSELGADADESEEEQLLASDEGEDPSRARSVCCERSLSNGGVQRTMSSSKAHELRRRHSTGAAMEAAESEPLVLRRREAKRANDVVETVDHPLGCCRRERESSSLLLLPS